MPDQDVGRYRTLTPLIANDDYGNKEMGWARTIDMDYKGKPDQWTGIKIHWWGSEKEFIQINKKLGLPIIDVRDYEEE